MDRFVAGGIRNTDGATLRTRTLYVYVVAPRCRLQNVSTVPARCRYCRHTVTANEDSRAFIFTPKMADITHTFATLKTTARAELSLTAGLYLYTNNVLVPENLLKAGDESFLVTTMQHLFFQSGLSGHCSLQPSYDC